MRRPSWLPALALLAVPILGAKPSVPSRLAPTATGGIIILAPSATPPIIIIQPSRTPTPPSSSFQTRTPTPTATPTPSPTPTLPSFAVPSPTFTPGSFAGELPATVTPHGDPYYTPELPLTLPSITPTFGSFTGPGVPDLSVRRVEVTQGMQNLDNDMPLVEHRLTVVRVYVCTDGLDWPDVRGGLQAWRNGQALAPGAGQPAGKALLPANGPIVARDDCGNRLHLDDSLYFYLPTSWTTGDVSLRAFVYGTDPHAPFEYEEQDSNNFRTVEVEFQPANPVVFRFIPLHLHEGYDRDNPTATFFPTPITFGVVGGWDISYDMFRLHPVAEMFVQLASEVVSPSFHWLGDEWKLNDADKQGKPLDLLEWYRHWEDHAPWYVGMVSPIFDQDYTGLSRIGKGVSWVIMNPEHFPTSLWNIRGGLTLAHELGHLAGLLHAACSDSNNDDVPDEIAGGSIDPDFPTGFPHCSLAPVDPDGFYGFDVYWDLWAYNTGPTVISNDPAESAPNRGFPLMGYAKPSWTDAYDYCLLLDHYGVDCDPGDLELSPPHPGGGGGVGPHADCTIENGPAGLPTPFNSPLWDLCLTSEGDPDWYFPQTTLGVIVARGSIDPASGEATIDEVARIADPPAVMLDAMVSERDLQLQRGATSPFHLQLETGDGTVLVVVPLIDDTTYHTPVHPLSFSILLPDVPGGEVVRVRSQAAVLGERRMSVSPPTIHILEPTGSLQPPLSLAWEAADPDGDPLTFTVLYSADQGQTWRVVADGLNEPAFALEADATLPGSQQGMFRVLANDGFLTASDDSGAVFQFPNRAPQVAIFGPANGLVVPLNGVVHLLGSGTDEEGGPLDPSQLTWSSDRDGVLGAGDSLVVRTLSAGEHTLTLSATDSAGNTSSAQVQLTVDASAVRWMPGPEEQAALADVLGAASGPAAPDEAPPRRRLSALAGPAILVGLSLLAMAGAGLLVYALRRRGAH